MYVWCCKYAKLQYNIIIVPVFALICLYFVFLFGADWIGVDWIEYNWLLPIWPATNISAKSFFPCSSVRVNFVIACASRWHASEWQKYKENKKKRINNRRHGKETKRERSCKLTQKGEQLGVKGRDHLALALPDHVLITGVDLWLKYSANIFQPSYIWRAVSWSPLSCLGKLRCKHQRYCYYCYYSYYYYYYYY